MDLTEFDQLDSEISDLRKQIENHYEPFKYSWDVLHNAALGQRVNNEPKGPLFIGVFFLKNIIKIA
ncbi:hypothetical protein [Hazenella coriacea]|uniref:Uncharacterized protein n=1 Tax=Hazenella coriacea TaxID=1179467 RepID=A0A4R3LE93_9BACL|nr:hypothetical protein [Hazenella coriacea]TCS95766.1 hypothetical protein EDD58_102346 [Hazenella coriacea]